MLSTLSIYLATLALCAEAFNFGPTPQGFGKSTMQVQGTTGVNAQQLVVTEGELVCLVFIRLELTGS